MLLSYDFAETFGGAERVAATLAATFPHAPFWAIAGRREVARRMGVEERFFTLLPPRPGLVDRFRALTPLYPALVSLRRLPAADVLVSSSFAFAHGMRTVNDAPQVCYCTSPLRFAWTMTDDYSGHYGPVGSTAFGGFAAAMRGLDRRLSRRVTRYIAESHYVADQIRRFYGRDSDVVWPPVDCDLFRPAADGAIEDYYLFSGRLIEPYKQPTMVVEAFRSLPRERLIIAGDGPEMERLKKIAPENVDFRGSLGDEELIPLMQRAKAVIFPSCDDFGLIPVEAMACGRPVLAFAGGGALETVAPGETGEFFERQEPDCLLAALRRFDPSSYDTRAIRTHAERWRVSRYERELKAIVGEVAGTA